MDSRSREANTLDAAQDLRSMAIDGLLSLSKAPGTRPTPFFSAASFDAATLATVANRATLTNLEKELTMVARKQARSNAEPPRKKRFRSAYPEFDRTDLDLIPEPGESWEYKFVGPVLRRKKNLEFYSILYAENGKTHFAYRIGDVVYFKSEHPQPYLATITRLYKNTNTDEDFVDAIWFYRPEDVAPDLLKTISFDPCLDIFISSETASNLVETICHTLNGVNVAFKNSPGHGTFDDITQKDQFICRFKYATRKKNNTTTSYLEKLGPK